MFKVFNAIVLYIVMGGIVLVMDANQYFKECNGFRTTDTAFFLVFAWPISLPLTLFSNDEMVAHAKAIKTCKQEPK